MPKPAGYTLTQIALHWGIALLILGQFLLNEPMGDAWRTLRRGGEALYSPLVIWHIAGGVLVLLLVIWRIAIKIKRGSPALPASEPRWQKIAAHATHGLLYLLMILLPISGLNTWFFGISIAADAHEIMANIIMVLIGLHFLAAMYHRIALKSGVMERMIRPE